MIDTGFQTFSVGIKDNDYVVNMQFWATEHSCPGTPESVLVNVTNHRRLGQVELYSTLAVSRAGISLTRTISR